MTDIATAGSTASRRSPKRAGYGARIVERVPADGSLVTADQLARASGLKRTQVLSGIAYLRDNYPQYPLLSSHAGYGFSVDATDITAFQRWRARVALTSVTRLWTGAIKPSLESMSDPSRASTITKQFERVIEDLSELVAEPVFR